MSGCSVSDFPNSVTLLTISVSAQAKAPTVAATLPPPGVGEADAIWAA
jgi:hypothetical protein